MFEAGCEVKRCMDLHKHSSREATPPDMYVQVDYGEYNGSGGKRKRLGMVGRTQVVVDAKRADFGGETLAYVRANATHKFRVRSIGYFRIRLRDREPHGHDKIGSTVVDLTDPGVYSKVPVGDGWVSFEVYAR